jgi:hypothetical protein
MGVFGGHGRAIIEFAAYDTIMSNRLNQAILSRPSGKKISRTNQSD